MAPATLPHTMYCAILACMLGEAFPARMRYTARAILKRGPAPDPDAAPAASRSAEAV
ncbi:MAG: hypothetical protein L0I76_32815 [Pseudonocardia sp.]|nr:hypothetical protein [Pseudonocardia sp.]